MVGRITGPSPEILSDPPPSYLYAVMPKLLMALGSMEMLEYTGWAKLTDQLHPCSYGEANFHESKDFTVQLLWIQPHPYRQNSSVLSKYKLIRFSSELWWQHTLFVVWTF